MISSDSSLGISLDMIKLGRCVKCQLKIECDDLQVINPWVVHNRTYSDVYTNWPSSTRYPFHLFSLYLFLFLFLLHYTVDGRLYVLCMCVCVCVFCIAVTYAPFTAQTTVVWMVSFVLIAFHVCGFPSTQSRWFEFHFNYLWFIVLYFKRERFHYQISWPTLAFH